MRALWLLLVLAQTSVEQDAMRQRAAQDRVRVRFLQREEASILKGLSELQRGIEDKQKNVERLQLRATEIEEKLESLDVRIVASEAELIQLRGVASKRAALMLRRRRTRLVDLLHHASNPADLRRLKERWERVVSHDAAFVRRVREASRADRDLRGSLANERAALEITRAELATEIESSLTLKAERAALLEAVKKERRAAERLARELGEAATKLEQELQVVRGVQPAPEPAVGGFGAQKGRLPWPVTGRVEVPFGKRVDPASGMVMVQRGIDVRAPQSALVRAVFAGKVAFASWFDGFGRLVILEHGDGFYSLYAHLERTEVAVGQTVNAHQVVGLVGDSGSTKGAYLYFEIRRGRDAVDPLPWLSK